MLATLVPACGLGPAKVARIVDGKPIASRYVPPEAYAAYARGAYLEAAGDPEAAIAAYVDAVSADPESVAAWTRLGALHCSLGRHQRSADAFDAAQSLDPGHEPLFRERARCEAARGRLDSAEELARKAVQLDPDAIEASLLLAALYEQKGDVELAARWLTALSLRHPASSSAWGALLTFSARHGRDASAERAARALAQLSPRQRERVARLVPATGLRQKLDQALLASDLQAARELAIEAGVAPGALAVRAAALGRADLAAEQSAWVLRSDPENGDAVVATLAAAGEGGAQRLDELLGGMWGDVTPPGALGARLLAELLAQRVGRQAADAWLSAYGPLPSPKDPLEARVAAHLIPRRNAAQQRPLPASAPPRSGP